jgi:hypothetical protein
MSVGIGILIVTRRKKKQMAVNEQYVADLVARLNADAEAREVERKALIEEVDPCDDEMCMWCN